MNPSGFSQHGAGNGGINPAMFAAFQQQKAASSFPNPNINPQLLNGSFNQSGMNGGPSTVSPGQLMQPPSMMGGGGGINPAALSGQQQHHQQQQQQHHQQQQLMAVLNGLGMSREQFLSLSQSDRQLALGKFSSANQQQQNLERMQLQQQQQIQLERERQAMGMGMSGGMSQMTGFERPSSSASSHSMSHNLNQNQMMPPPPPRPPTAQGGGMLQQQMQQQVQHQSSRPGTSMAHRSPTIGGPPTGSMQDMQRPQSRIGQRDNNSMNGFKPQQQQQQSQQQGNQQSMFSNQGPHGRPPSSQGNHNNSSAPPPSASPPASMNSPYHGTKRKLPGDMSSSGGNSGNMGMGGGMGMNMGMGNMNNMNNMAGMPNPMSGGGNSMGNPMASNPMSRSMSGMGNMPNMSNPMAGDPMGNLGGMQGMGGMGNMPGLAQMGGMGGMGGGVPASPRIGSSMSLSGGMGPPGLPRSISGDGGMSGMGGMGGGGGMGGSMGSMMTNMGGMPNTMNMGGMGMVGGGGGSAGGGGMSNMGGAGNMGMNAGMMNGQRNSPRPQSSMGMTGMGGQMGGMPGMGMGPGGGPGGAGAGGMGMGGAGMGMPPGAGGGGGMGGAGMNMNMNIDIPARGAPHSMAGPQTPMRQGSMPPQTATPPHAQIGQAHPHPPHTPGTPMRQGSLPPGAGAMGTPGGMGPMGTPGGMGGMGTPGGMGGMGTPGGMGGMARPGMPAGMGMSAMGPMAGIAGSSASPHPGAGGLGMGGAPPLGPSISTSSITSMGGAQGVPAIPSGAVSGGQGAPAGPSAIVSSSGLPGSSSLAASSSGETSVNGLASGSASSAPVVPSLPPPSGANYNPKTTEVTLVPLATSTTTIPPLSAAEIEQVQDWMATDRAYEARVHEMQGRMLEEVRETFSIGGSAGVQWWERGAPGNGVGNWNRWRKHRESFDVRYPRSRREHASRSGRKGARRQGLKLPRKIEPEDADKPEVLVPIRIEFDVEHHKMRDTFVWNLNDPVVTPEVFAQSVVEDYALAPSYHAIIVKAIQDQLSDFRAHAVGLEGEGSEAPEQGTIIKGELDEDDAKWWEVWRRRIKLQSARAIAEAKGYADDDDEDEEEDSRRARSSSRKRRKIVKIEDLDDDADADVSMMADNEEEDDEEEKIDMDEEGFSPRAVDEYKVDEKSMHEDMRIVIKLDIIVGSVKLDDQFEWDLDNPSALPEEFAEVYTQELGLGGEFKTAISHSIREQVQTYQKSLFLVGHPSDGTAVQDDDLKQSFLPSLTSGARPGGDVSIFTPVLTYLSDGELDRTEKERDKDLNKRRKRNTRGRRGVALPDREPIRTYRTPAIGFPELDPATLALAAAANAPMSRRAAAAAASLTIANMVASENGIAFTPQVMPTVPQPPPVAAAAKEKKPKGLFKPPSYPSSVLRPRAHVTAPTPSTAADVSMSSIPADNEAPRSSSSVAPSQLNNQAKIMTAKRAKELEREAKEKEFVDGQHPNYIDGVWHCSNCGCPESIAVGRRKGPLGNKSQCGTCGKFWHRHRRPRPVEYNADPSFHSGIKQKELEAKTPASKKRGAAALRAQSALDTSEPQTPSRSNGDVDGSRRSASPHGNDDDRAISPISTASSASEPPLAQRVKVNGSGHAKTTSTSAPAPALASAAPSTPVKASAAPEALTSPPAPAPATSPTSPTKTRPPQWLSAAIQAMQARYPHDKFEVILRKVNASSTPEWRIKCLDCPGKLYTPGPGETLSNYDVHLKNRQHRQRVNDRLAGITSTSAPPGSTAPTSTGAAAAVSASAPVSGSAASKS